MKIVFIGVGNMGGAIVRGLLKNSFDASKISVIDINKEVVDSFVKLGCKNEAVSVGDVVVVAVKPWQVSGIANMVNGARSVISIAAGISVADLKEVFKTEKVVRVIPNTAVEYLQGASFITGNEDCVNYAVEIFERVGKAFIVDEKLLNGCMALSSCGLAYALRYARASQVGGVELGIKPEIGQRIIAQTLRGAAAILENGNHPESEIDKVTTPGGITIKGLNAMEKNGFTNAVIEGLLNSK